MTPISVFSWLYDVDIGETGIRFVLFGAITIHLVKYSNIQSVKEVSPTSLGTFTAYNFKNRLFAKTFLLKLRRGWFARKILVTPKSPGEFISVLEKHNIDIQS